MTTTTPKEYINSLLTPSTGRQLPQRHSPLVHHFVAAGHYYDPHTGLVSPSGGSANTTPPVASTTKDDCLPGVSEYERICPSGVKVAVRPSHPPF